MTNGIGMLKINGRLGFFLVVTPAGFESAILTPENADTEADSCGGHNTPFARIAWRFVDELLSDKTDALPPARKKHHDVGPVPTDRPIVSEQERQSADKEYSGIVNNRGMRLSDGECWHTRPLSSDEAARCEELKAVMARARPFGVWQACENWAMAMEIQASSGQLATAELATL